MKKRAKKKTVQRNPRKSEEEWGEVPIRAPRTTGRKRPRSQAKYENFRRLDENTGKQWGDVGVRVPASETNPAAGEWGLDKSGREVMWFPSPETEKRKRK